MRIDAEFADKMLRAPRGGRLLKSVQRKPGQIRIRSMSVAMSMLVGFAINSAGKPSAQDGTVSSAEYSPKPMVDGKQWTTLNLSANTVPSYCYDDSVTNCLRYGRVYTWESARRACELLGDGWRLPTDEEWRQLARYYGGVSEDSNDRGRGAYKALSPGGEAKFDALLGGGRSADGQYARLQAHGFYWTGSENGAAGAWFYNFGRGSEGLHRQSGGEKDRAFSVRCVRP
jgi:uncharacterized protein (TIGR02145 family)